jgi:F1F0 ATPase subunit 2
MEHAAIIIIIQLLLAFTAGAAIGIFYFGSLWITVRRLPKVNRPGLLILGSFAVRAGITLLGFFLVMGGQWERLVACLLGFMLARKLSVKRASHRRAGISSG